MYLGSVAGRTPNSRDQVSQPSLEGGEDGKARKWGRPKPLHLGSPPSVFFKTSISRPQRSEFDEVLIFSGRGRSCHVLFVM